MTGPMATRLAGSSDLYEPSGRRPYHSINFITSHDGFPLNDLVSYERKHNEANGEDNRDGDNNNYSGNYGVEGPTRRKSIVDLRQRQVKNMHGHAAAQPGRADDRRGRRSAAHAARQQQRLLPRQRHQLVRLEAGREERRDAPLRAGAHRVPPPPAERSPRPRSSPAKPPSRANFPTSAGSAPTARRSIGSTVGSSLTSVFGTSGVADRPRGP